MKPISTPWTVFTNFARKTHHGNWIELAITVSTGLGSMLFGYDQGVMGGLLTGAPFEKQFPSLTTNSSLQGFVVAVYELGCAAGAIGVLVAGQKISRRGTILLGMTILSIGAILQFTSFSLAQMIVARIITGIGNGMNSTISPTYNGECSRGETRGRNVAGQLSLNILGIAISYWVDYGFNTSASTRDSSAAWRVPLAIQVVIALLVFVLLLFLPESPRYLIHHGQLDEARDVLDMLETEPDHSRRSAIVEEKLKYINVTLEEESSGASSNWSDVFNFSTKERFGQRTVLATVTLCMLQISGINLITYYAPVIFQKSLGMSRNESLLMSGYNGVAYWASTLVPIPLIDRVGRRPLLLFAAIGQMASMAIIAAMTEDVGNYQKGVVATSFLFIFNFFFAVGFCAIPFLMPMELVPLKTRPQAVAIATMCFWLCNFLVAEISPVMIDNIQWKTYVVWACTNLVFIPFIWFCVPETMNAQLEDIDMLFESSNSWFIGPSSKRKLAALIRENKHSRIEAHAEGPAMGAPDSKEKLDGQHVDMVENI